MLLVDLIKLVERKLVNLQTLYSSAESLGDIERLTMLQDEINTTQGTLDQLRNI